MLCLNLWGLKCLISGEYYLPILSDTIFCARVCFELYSVIFKLCDIYNIAITIIT